MTSLGDSRVSKNPKGISFHLQQRQLLTRLRTQEKKERGSCTSLGGRIDSHMRACQCVDVCVYVQYVYVCILVHVGVYVRKGVSVHSYMRA